jgi:hypothetical protein
MQLSIFGRPKTPTEGTEFLFCQKAKAPVKEHHPQFDPLKVIRRGNVEASIWQVGDQLSTKIARVYWQHDEWKYSIEFELADLSDLAKAAAEAQAWITNPFRRTPPHYAPPPSPDIRSHVS